MAARYVDTANIVAQGQSFYTGLLPGSYEQQAGGAPRGGNVYGKGSGGSAGVTADRTASEAAGMSIAHKAQKGPTPGSIFGFDSDESDADRVIGAIKQGPDNPNYGGVQTPIQPGPAGQGGQGGQGGQAGPLPTPIAKPTRSTSTRTPQQQAARTAKAREDRETVNKATAMGGIDTLVPAADLKFGMEEVTKSKGPTDYIKDSTMGQWSGSVQRRASTRAQTRQAGVQQSATHKSFLYPNMANSTNRSLNF